MTRKLTRRDALKGVGAAGMAGLAGCSNITGGGGRTIKQGVLLPLTGGLGELGVPIKNGAILPFKQLEKDSPSNLSFDHQVEDTQTDPSAAVSAANSLKNAGYPGITGAASSEVSINVYKNVLIPSGILGCSPASTSPAISDLEDNNLVWRTPPTDKLQGRVLAQVARERESASTASVMYVNNSYGQLLANSFSSAFKNQGGTVQKKVSFEKGQSSYTARLEQALADDPDTMVVIGYPESGVQLFRDFYSDFNASLPILVTDGLRSASLPKNVGNAMKNVKGTAPLAAGPGKKFFTEQFKKAYGNEPGVFTSQAYDATAVCLLANAAAGENKGTAIAGKMREIANPGGDKKTYTPDNLPKALEAAAAGKKIEYQGASSAVDFDKNGDLKAATYELFGFKKGGGIETIDTIKFAA